MKYYVKEIIKYFDIKYNPTLEWINIKCPLHDDNQESAGINLKKNYFNCFVCGSKSLMDLHKEIFGEEDNMGRKKKNVDNGNQFNIDEILQAQPKPKLSKEEILDR